MPTAPRYVHRSTKLNTQALKKKIEQTYLDTRPGSPARSRLDQILMNRVNTTAVVSAKYYAGTFKGLGDALRDPKFPPFPNTSRPRKLARSLSVPLRDVALPRYAFQTPRQMGINESKVGTISAGRSAHLRPVRKTETRVPVSVVTGQRKVRRMFVNFHRDENRFEVDIPDLKVKSNIMEGQDRTYAHHLVMRGSKADRLEDSLIIKPTQLYRGNRSVAIATDNYTPLAQKIAARIPKAERVRLESGAQSARAWKGLSPDYMRGEGFWKGYQKSKSFWRKTGKLSSAYDAWYAGAEPRLTDPSKYISSLRKTVQPNVKLTGGRPRLAHISFQITVPSLNMPANPLLNAALRASFLRGQAMDISPPPVRKVLKRRVWVNGKGRTTISATADRPFTIVDITGLNRLHAPEYYRPFVRRYVAEMGKRYDATLKNVLKP